MTLSVTLLAMGGAAIWISGTKKHTILISHIKESVFGKNEKNPVKENVNGSSIPEPEASRPAAGLHNPSGHDEAIHAEVPRGDGLV